MKSAVGIMTSIIRVVCRKSVLIFEHSVSVVGRSSMLNSTARLRSVGITTGCKNNPEQLLRRQFAREPEKTQPSATPSADRL